MERFRHVEGENGRLRNKVHEAEHRIAELTDSVSNLTRVNAACKEQAVENDMMMQRVAQEIRMMHVEVDRRRRE